MENSSCQGEKQMLNNTRNRFRWKYHTIGTEWTEWKYTDVYGSGIRNIPLWAGTHAGTVSFSVLVNQDSSYSAVIEWTNTLHYLRSIDSVVFGLSSQVKLRVEKISEVTKPDTFYLLVERIE